LEDSFRVRVSDGIYQSRILEDSFRVRVRRREPLEMVLSIQEYGGEPAITRETLEMVFFQEKGGEPRETLEMVNRAVRDDGNWAQTLVQE